MLLKNSALAIAAALALAPLANAAESKALQATIKAVIPAADGLIVTPVNGWTNTPQTMNWEGTSETLQPVNQAIDIKSPSDVNAYLADAPQLNNGSTLVPMSVRIGGNLLGVGAAAKVPVATAAEATGTVRKPTQISAAKPGSGFEPGDYDGVVTMIFENE